MKGGMFQKAQAQTARRPTSREPREGSAPAESRESQEAQEHCEGGHMDETTRVGGMHPRDDAAQAQAGTKKLMKVGGNGAEAPPSVNSGPSSGSTSAPLGGSLPPVEDDEV